MQPIKILSTRNPLAADYAERASREQEVRAWQEVQPEAQNELLSNEIDIEAANNQLINHVNALPPAARVELLSAQEKCEFQKHIAGKGNAALTLEMNRALSKYESEVNQNCGITLNSLSELTDPLVVKHRNIERVYEREAFNQHIQSCSGRDKVAEDPFSRDPLALKTDNNQDTFRRGLPTAILEFIKVVRRFLHNSDHKFESHFFAGAETKAKKEDLFPLRNAENFTQKIEKQSR